MGETKGQGVTIVIGAVHGMIPRMAFISKMSSALKSAYFALKCLFCLEKPLKALKSSKSFKSTFLGRLITFLGA